MSHSIKITLFLSHIHVTLLLFNYTYYFRLNFRLFRSYFTGLKSRTYIYTLYTYYLYILIYVRIKKAIIMTLPPPPLHYTHTRQTLLYI